MPRHRLRRVRVLAEAEMARPSPLNSPGSNASRSGRLSTPGLQAVPSALRRMRIDPVHPARNWRCALFSRSPRSSLYSMCCRDVAAHGIRRVAVHRIDAFGIADLPRISLDQESALSLGQALPPCRVGLVRVRGQCPRGGSPWRCDCWGLVSIRPVAVRETTRPTAQRSHGPLRCPSQSDPPDSQSSGSCTPRSFNAPSNASAILCG